MSERSEDCGRKVSACLGHRSPDDLMFFQENGYWPSNDCGLGITCKMDVSQSSGNSSQREKSNVKKNDQPTYSTAAPNDQPTQLIEMAGLEIRRRALSKELAQVNSEMSRLYVEILVLGIEIPWLARGRRVGIR